MCPVFISSLASTPAFYLSDKAQCYSGELVSSRKAVSLPLVQEAKVEVVIWNLFTIPCALLLVVWKVAAMAGAATDML